MKRITLLTMIVMLLVCLNAVPVFSAEKTTKTRRVKAAVELDKAYCNLQRAEDKKKNYENLLYRVNDYLNFVRNTPDGVKETERLLPKIRRYETLIDKCNQRIKRCNVRLEKAIVKYRRYKSQYR